MQRYNIALTTLFLTLAACGGDPGAARDASTTPDVVEGRDAVEETGARDVPMEDLPVVDISVDRVVSPDTACVDSDGDGYPTTDCGGRAPDCDDANDRVNPGRSEVCDAMGVDEDCNPCTVASATTRDGDGDGDTFVSAGCFNRYGGSTPTCDPLAVRINGGALRVTGRDCDDTNGNVRPNQRETCNGVDDNCDGATDEGVTRTGYPDADGDGFGDMRAPATMTPGCTLPVGTVENHTDCDDARGSGASIHPGALEICDGVDNNCDGVTDEAGMVTLYRDADGDGHGESSMPLTSSACARPGYVVSADDCDDRAATTYPGAPELCDRVDNDCSPALSGGADPSEDRDGDRHSPLDATCRGGFPRDDCDDGEARTFADNTEVCDGVDNDCDRSVDEEPSASATCALPHAGGSCSRARCLVVRCDQNFADCDGEPGDGCEVDLRASADHCGSCGNRCGAGTTCRAGRCDAVAQMAAGDEHACLLRAGGTVVCWGRNNQGQLGDGTRMGRTTPGVAVTGLTDAVEVVAGYAHTCARQASGAVVCWGQEGIDPSADHLSPVGIAGLVDAVELAAGDYHTCALRAGGAVVCWGSGSAGQRGDGRRESGPTPVTVAGLTDAVEVAAGERHTCARRRSGGIVCWGENPFGQLGSGTRTDSLVPVAVTGLTDAVEVAAGPMRTCARRLGGTVVCWGFASQGLGDGTRDSRMAPVAVLGLTAAAEIGVGPEHTCARRSDGIVLCWGGNDAGQLGDGTTTARLTPSPVAGRTDAVEIALGGNYTCARRTTGAVVCWGANNRGQLGIGTTVASPSPVAAAGLVDPREISAGHEFSCARLSSGGVLCWGRNQFGQLGDGTTTDQSTPGVVRGLDDAVEISTGRTHACARRLTSGVVCWGSNSSGQLGDGTTTNRATPLAIATPTDIVEISAGSEHTCARRLSGSVLCWGRNLRGQLGDGTNTDRTAPVVVTGLTDAVEISAGGSHTCARRAIGGVVCWGSNISGPLGDGTGMDRSAPVAVVDLADAVEISAGDVHTCARRAGGGIACWGSNSSSQLGDGTTQSRLSPVPVLGAAGTVELTAAYRHSCARRSDGTVICWGTGGGAAGGTPVAVSGLTDAVEITAGLRQTCARRSAGPVVCFGGNDVGQLGDGTTTPRATPVAVIGLP